LRQFPLAFASRAAVAGADQFAVEQVDPLADLGLDAARGAELGDGLPQEDVDVRHDDFAGGFGGGKRGSLERGFRGHGIM
jgi:hypothetical protein